MDEKNVITIKQVINTSVEKVWEYWNSPEHIMKWNNASEDWHTTYAESDLRAGGRFLSRMEAKDGSFGFDFSGKFDEVILNQKISYTLDDFRKVNIEFEKDGENITKVTESFEAEGENSLELQQMGWQSILDNFKTYAETN